MIATALLALLPLAAPPTQDQINVANVIATNRFEEAANLIELPPGTVFLGYDACYSQWETEYLADTYGQRIESLCYGLVSYAGVPHDSGDSVIALTGVLTGTVEHLADGSVEVWGMYFYVNDARFVSLADDREVIFNQDGTIRQP